jgi:hypothetical protein
MHNNRLSRRHLLKLGGGILAAAPFVHVITPAFAKQPDPLILPARRPFGRAIHSGLVVREMPSIKARQVRTLKQNEIVGITGQAASDNSPTTYNKIWYRVEDGFIYSAHVQPSENTLNKPLETVDEKGFWGEITVPLTEARSLPQTGTTPGSKSRLRYSYYFGSVFRIIASIKDQTNTFWYQIDDEYSGKGFYAKAEHIRPIPPDEFAPISPDVPMDQKRMEVNLAAQTATAYEGDKAVFSARVATGVSFRLADGTVRNFGTTPGNHRIYLKRPSQHMVGGAASDNDYYDLPGIGWISYFTASGIAFHGTYWHNDYGSPRSHGCVNMLPEDAKWVFLWTLPTAPYEDHHTRTSRRTDGTLVKVF